MRDIVAAEYPEREAHIPEAARQGEVPASVLASMRAMQEVGRAEDTQGRTWCKRTNLIREKNATPPPRGEEASKCLDRLRPMAMCADRTNAADREPGVAREGALKHFGNMMVQTGSRYLSQWCPEYFFADFALCHPTNGIWCRFPRGYDQAVEKTEAGGCATGRYTRLCKSLCPSGGRCVSIGLVRLAYFA